MRMSPLADGCGGPNRVFNIHVIVSKICCYFGLQDLLSFRGVNRAADYTVLLYMKASRRQPIICLSSDGDLIAYLDTMTTRHLDYPTFSSFCIALHSTTVETLEIFVKQMPGKILNLEFVESHNETTWELTPAQESPEDQHDATLLYTFGPKILTFLKAKGGDIRKLALNCMRDVLVYDTTDVGVLENLRELQIYYLSNSLSLTNDLASFVVARAPNLEILEVCNFFGLGRFHYSPQLLPGLARLLNREAPPFLKLRTIIRMDDIVALERLLRQRFNRLRYLEFLLEFEPEFRNANFLDRFTNFLQFQSPSLEEMSIVVAGQHVTELLRLPILNNLKVLAISSCINSVRAAAIYPILQNQFPKLECLEICGYNLYKHLLRDTVIHSMKVLNLDFEEEKNLSPTLEAATTDTIHINFPNLNELELRDMTYMNLKRIDYVFVHLAQLETLILTTRLSLKNKRGNTFWKTFAGEEQKASKATTLRLCQDDCENLSKLEQNATSSLASMKNLKVLEISVTLSVHLAVLAYMSRSGRMEPLDKLYVGFTQGNRICQQDKHDYLGVLRKYHKEVIEVELTPPCKIPI